jgi:diguanylate cyclase (GGDEF)-like protein/PAS domain S-box-containing protein
LTLLITPLHQQFKFLLFFLAVLASATGGTGPGVFATLLSVAAADYFLIEPLRSFAISDPLNLVPLLVFCGVGLVTTWIIHRLQRSEETLRTAAAVIESSADSIMRQSLDNTILSWNKAAEQMYGYTAEEAIGRPISLIVPPDRREELEHLVERVHQGGSVQSHETVRMRKDGAHIDVALTLSPFRDRQGRVVGVSSIAQGITERKLAEETLRERAALLELAHDSIMVRETNGTIRFWNRGAVEMYGYSPEEAIGRISHDLLRTVFPQPLAEIEAGLMREGRWEGELRHTCRDGTLIVVASRWALQRENGRSTRVMEIDNDITERKRAEEALRQSNAQLERQARQMKLLAEMGEMLQASSIPADAYAVAARFAQTLIPESSGSLFVYSASRNNLEAVIRWGEPHQNEPDFLAPNECWALRTGRLHLVEDPHSGLLCRHLPEPPLTCYLCAPMIAHGETLGMLYLRMSRLNQDSSEAALPKPLELTLLAGSMAERLALALADMNLRETLRAQSIRDPLTGWYNRRYMEETLEREIRRAARNKGPLAIIMLDIDNFKEFNDSFGHEAGDVALKDLCQMLKTHIRSEDVACRYGGDEFVLILPDISAEVAAERAEEMRIAVGHERVQYFGHLVKPMTLSFGIATFPADGGTCQELLRASDTALFRAKGEGRDRVRLHGQASEPTTGN